MAYNKRELIDKIQSIDILSSGEKSALLELLRSHKKYGLVWEDKQENIEEKLRNEIPVLHEVKNKAIICEDKNAPNHIVIEGDNLEALTALSYSHEGKIDVIYIDPPYNTGNKDFIYNDSYVDKEDSYRHSKWLSFMNKRLKIAKRLLSANGVIFISIDDNEQAQLKLLCDDIFGEDNFAGDISWQRSYSPRNDSKGISNEKEHLLVYTRDENWVPGKLPRTSEMNSKYKNPDNDFAAWRSSDAFAPGASSHQGMVYAIQHPFTGKLIYPYKGAHWPLQQDSMLEEMNKWAPYKYEQLNDDQERADVCGISLDEIRKSVPAIILDIPIEEAKKLAQEKYDKGPWPNFFFSNKGMGGIARKTYITNVSGKNVTNLWLHSDVGNTDEAKKEIAKIFNGEKRFDTPKPIRLLNRILQISTTANSTILDFFAGSGTTLHATMQLNADDGGHRQCILSTNNENSICEQVTYERNKRVIQGYTTPKGVNIEGLSNNSLRYYKTSLISRERSQKNMRELVNASTDLLCIKENLYKEQLKFGRYKVNPHLMRYFADKGKYMLIVYREEIVDQLVAEISNMDFGNGRLKIYIFSPARYAFNDNFYEVKDKVQLIALPAAIYDAYEKVLPKRDKIPFALEEITDANPQDSTDLFINQQFDSQE